MPNYNNIYGGLTNEDFGSSPFPGVAADSLLNDPRFQVPPQPIEPQRRSLLDDPRFQVPPAPLTKLQQILMRGGTPMPIHMENQRKIQLNHDPAVLSNLERAIRQQLTY